MPAPVVPRLITVTYGGLSVGGATDYQLTGFHHVEGDLGELTVELDVVVRDTTVAGCRALAQALETAFRKRDQDLSIAIDGETFLSVAQDANTGVNARATWALTDFARTKKSRTYHCTVTVLRPADDLAEKNGRQAGSWSLVTNDVGQRTLTLRATYTALPDGGSGALSATEVVTEYFDDWADEVKALIDPAVEWDEELGRDVEPDHNDKIATVTATFTELTFDQASGERNSASLVGAQYQISTFRVAQPQAANSGAAEPIAITVAFSTGFRLAEVQPDEIKTKVEELLVAYCFELVTDYSDAVGAAVPVEKNVTVDPSQNRANGTMTFVVYGTNLVRASLKIADYENTGVGLVPVMDGRPFSRDLHRSPAARRRMITVTTIVRGTAEDSGGLEGAVRRAEGQGYHLLEVSRESEAFERGLPGSNNLARFVESAYTATLEYAEIRNVSGGSGGTRVKIPSPFEGIL